MIHYGDITKINGEELPPVDIITGGSPCQDLSVAGKRAGLSGLRSGLFMEQVRIIKEMREATNGKYPRFEIWENVPGALSSNKGEDFRIVLEETVRIVEPDAVVPGPPKGKWTPAGCIMGNGWSIAWRIHDAQFWGVPQRRRRISLVADFRGGGAPEILFERKGVSGDTAESGEERKGTPEDAVRRADETVLCLNDQGGQQMDVSVDVSRTLRAQEHGHQPIVFEPGSASRVGGHIYDDGVTGSLRANAGDNLQAVVTLTTEMTPKIDENGIAFSLRERDYKDAPCVCYGIGGYNSEGMLSPNPHSGIYEAETARTLDNNGGNPACNQGGIVVLEGNGARPSHQGDGYAESETMYTLNATEHHAVCIGNGQADIASHITDEVAQTLNCMHDQLAVCIENHPSDSRIKIHDDGIVQTLSTRMGTGGNNVPLVGTFSIQRTNDYKESDQSHTLSARDYKSATDLVVAHTLKAKANCDFRADSETYVVTAVDCRNGTEHPHINGTLQAKSNGGMSLNCQNVCRIDYVVRRLTPLECERLQGFPDGWTDIGDWTDGKGKVRKCSDSARYKALGNSIALPFWEWLARRMVTLLPENPTMGSLFDGIGGFPLAFSRCGCKALWASEIEEFCIAVTKKRFMDL